MDAVLLIAGLFVLWIWLHGHPIGALVVFVALFVVLGADAHPDSPFMTIHNEVITLGYLAAFALAPMTILSIYRDLKKGRGSRLAYFGDMALTSLTAPPVPQAQKPEDRCWTKEVIQAYFDNYSWSKADLEAWAGAPAEQLARQGLSDLERGYMLLGAKKPITSHGSHGGASGRSSARQTVNKPTARPRFEPVFDKPIR